MFVCDDLDTVRWAETAPRLKLARPLRESVKQYTESAYADIWHFYDQDKNYACLQPDCLAFDQIWEYPLHAHQDLVLFEGQGAFEHDMLDAKVGDVVLRKRPTSSSWSLAAAREFASGVLLVHHVSDPSVKVLVLRDLATNPLECEVLLQPGLVITVTDEKVLAGFPRVLHTSVGLPDEKDGAPLGS